MKVPLVKRSRCHHEGFSGCREIRELPACFHSFSLPPPETSVPLSTSFLPTFSASIPVVLSVSLLDSHTHPRDQSVSLTLGSFIRFSHSACFSPLPTQSSAELHAPGASRVHTQVPTQRPYVNLKADGETGSERGGGWARVTQEAAPGRD